MDSMVLLQRQTAKVELFAAYKSVPHIFGVKPQAAPTPDAALDSLKLSTLLKPSAASRKTCHQSLLSEVVVRNPYSGG
jgi:hypothetical protein